MRFLLALSLLVVIVAPSFGQPLTSPPIRSGRWGSAGGPRRMKLSSANGSRRISRRTSSSATRSLWIVPMSLMRSGGFMRGSPICPLPPQPRTTNWSATGQRSGDASPRIPSGPKIPVSEPRSSSSYRRQQQGPSPLTPTPSGSTRVRSPRERPSS